MVIAGYSLALLMGLTLGVIGGGGSILTLPILVYLLGVPPVEATAYSLLVVGLTGLVGAWRYHLQQLINFRVGLVFAIPSVLGVWLARAFALPLMPEVLLTADTFTLTKDAFVMLLFAALMIVVAVFMLRKKPLVDHGGAPATPRKGLIALEGFGVGAITGIVGAGGGFLIVPALVFFANLPMRQAVATSLAIIAAKSLLGFTGDLMAGFTPAPALTILFTGLTIAGMIVGIQVARKATDSHLKAAFGGIVLLLGLAIMADQIYTIF